MMHNPVVLRFAVVIGCLVLTAPIARAQDLADYFGIIRSEGPPLSEGARIRTSEILKPYLERQKDIANEWPTVNGALQDSNSIVRGQAVAFLSVLVFTNQARPIAVPQATYELVIRQFGEPNATTRENAVRIIALMQGGMPPGIRGTILQIARTDPGNSVRRVAIATLNTMESPTPDIVEFWKKSLDEAADKILRGMVLSSFRLRAPRDPEVIALVIRALKDPDRFVVQEAIAAIVQIGPAARSALPYLEEIRDSQPSDEVLQVNVRSAIRILTEASPSR